MKFKALSVKLQETGSRLFDEGELSYKRPFTKWRIFLLEKHQRAITVMSARLLLTLTLSTGPDKSKLRHDSSGKKMS